MERISRTGALPCFCEFEAEKGASKDQLYSGTNLFGPFSEPICEEQIEYLSIFGLYQIIKQALSVMIVV